MGCATYLDMTLKENQNEQWNSRCEELDGEDENEGVFLRQGRREYLAKLHSNYLMLRNLV